MRNLQCPRTVCEIVFNLLSIDSQVCVETPKSHRPNSLIPLEQVTKVMGGVKTTGMGNLVGVHTTVQKKVARPSKARAMNLLSQRVPISLMKHATQVLPIVT